MGGLRGRLALAEVPEVGHRRLLPIAPVHQDRPGQLRGDGLEWVVDQRRHPCEGGGLVTDGSAEADDSDLKPAAAERDHEGSARIAVAGGFGGTQLPRADRGLQDVLVQVRLALVVADDFGPELLEEVRSLAADRCEAPADHGGDRAGGGHLDAVGGKKLNARVHEIAVELQQRHVARNKGVGGEIRVDADALHVDVFAAFGEIVGPGQHLDLVRIGIAVDAVGGRHHPVPGNEDPAAELGVRAAGDERDLEGELSRLGLFSTDDGLYGGVRNRLGKARGGVGPSQGEFLRDRVGEPVVESLEDVLAIVVGDRERLGRIADSVAVLVQEDDEGGDRLLLLVPHAVGVRIVPDRAGDLVLAGAGGMEDGDRVARGGVRGAPVVGDGEAGGVGAGGLVGMGDDASRSRVAVPEVPGIADDVSVGVGGGTGVEADFEGGGTLGDVNGEGGDGAHVGRAGGLGGGRVATCGRDCGERDRCGWAEALQCATPEWLSAGLLQGGPYRYPDVRAIGPGNIRCGVCGRARARCQSAGGRPIFSALQHPTNRDHRGPDQTWKAP